MSDLTNSVLVTGATGFVGSGVVSRLAAEDVETLAYVRRDIDPMQEGVRDILVAELTANTDWRLVLAGVKSVVNFPLACMSCTIPQPTR
jgi:nucleoside-diphosphate-sugar epimerase